MDNVILLSTIAGTELRSRITLQSILKQWDDAAKNIFDFSGITFISRSFADELYTFAENKSVVFVHMAGIVKQMYEVVEQGRKQKRVHTADSADIVIIKTPAEFMSYTSQF